jgi:hypothetical protein
LSITQWRGKNWIIQFVIIINKNKLLLLLSNNNWHKSKGEVYHKIMTTIAPHSSSESLLYLWRYCSPNNDKCELSIIHEVHTNENFTKMNRKLSSEERFHAILKLLNFHEISINHFHRKIWLLMRKRINCHAMVWK